MQLHAELEQAQQQCGMYQSVIRQMRDEMEALSRQHARSMVSPPPMRRR